MNPPVNDPFSQPGASQSITQDSPENLEVMQMRQSMRDNEHINLLAIFHYVWAGLIGLGAVGGISYLFMMESVMKDVMSMPTSTPTKVPATPSPASTSATPSKAVSPASSLVPASAPVSPAPTPRGTTIKAGGGATTWKTTTTSSSMPAHVMSSMIKMFYIIYGSLAALLLIGLVCNVLSARFLQKKKYRVFTMVVGAINVLMFPIGTVLGVFTFIVLCRHSVAQKYTPVDVIMQRDPR